MQQTKSTTKTLRPKSQRLVLEPRIVFDAVLPVMGAEIIDHIANYSSAKTNHVIEAPAVETPASADNHINNNDNHAASDRALIDGTLAPNNLAAKEIIFIDAIVADLQQYITDHPNADVVLLDANRDGLAQIAATLAGRTGIESVHIISHGSAGNVSLGNTSLNLAGIQGQYADELATIKAALSADADILIYGCNVAEGQSGQAFVNALSSATGADIAASTDNTGAANLGGNWALENKLGIIDTVNLSLNDFSGLLAAPSVAGFSTIRVGNEDSPITINGLSIADADGNNQTVTLTAADGKINLASVTGLTGLTGNNTGAVTFSGTLASINAAINGLIFTPTTDFNGATTLGIQTNDGTTTVSRYVDIQLAPINDIPFSFVPLPANILTVNEGGTGTYGPVVIVGQGYTDPQLGFSDPDNTPTQTIIKITQLPAQGTLKLNGIELAVGSTFSLAQLNLVSYTHNSAQVTTPGGILDGFKITVDDGAGGILINEPVEVRVLPVNQAPTASGTISVIEGEINVRLDNNGTLAAPYSTPRGAIAIGDPEGQAITTYSITSLPANGTLSYNGVAIAAASPGSPFLVADRTLLTYSHNGSETIADSFNIRVTDNGGGAGTPLTTDSTINLDIRPNNDDPILATNVTQTVPAASSGITLTPAMLNVTDADSANAQLTYTVTSVPSPAAGYFTRNDQTLVKTLVAGATFTQADINAGLVQYVTVSTAARTDSLSFTVKDGGQRILPTVRDGGIYTSPTGNTLQTNTFNINVPNTVVAGVGAPASAPINVAPVTGGSNSFTGILEAQTVTFTSTNLNATDADNTPAQIVYRLQTVPTSGAVLLNGVALKLNQSFTQADVNAGLVTFAHAGGEDFIDSFQYSVSDGKSTTAIQTFNLGIVPQNDTPTAAVGTRVFLPEGSTQVINASNITLADADNSVADLETGFSAPQALTFEITGNVANGQLRLNGVNVGVGAIVTQAQLNAGQLSYTHNGSENFTDSFRLVPIDDRGISAATVNNQVSRGTELIVPITISPVNDAPVLSSKSEYVTGQAGPILEGAKVVIGGATSYATINGIAGSGTPTPSAGARLVYSDTDNSSEQRQYRITTAPINGFVLLNGVPLGVGSVFTQAQLDAGLVEYDHDGTETFSDSFSYVVSDGDFTANDTTSFAQGTAATPSTFNIEIRSSNDKPKVVAPTNPIDIDSATGSNNPVLGFSISDTDLTTVGASETDFVQVTVRMLNSNGTAFSVADYTTGGNVLINATPSGSAVIDGDKNGVGDYLVIRGTRSDVNATLANLNVAFPNDRDALYKLEAIVDDRLRDPAGVLTSGANGGTTNERIRGVPGVPPILGTEIDWYTAAEDPLTTDGNRTAASVLVRASSVNDPAVIALPPTITVNEDQRTIINGFTVQDVESTVFDLPVSVTLSVPAGQGTLDIAGSSTQTSFLVSGRTVTITGDNTGTLILTGRADDIQTLLNDPVNGLAYLGALNVNHDLNGAAAGDVTLTMSIDDAGARIGGDVGAGSVAAVPAPITSAITVTATNDAPNVAAVGTGVTVAAAGVLTPTTGFNISDVDYTDGGGITAPGEVDFIQATIRLVDSFGNPIPLASYAGGQVALGSSTPGGVTVDATENGSSRALIIRGTQAQVNAYLAGLNVTLNGAIANSDLTYRVQVIADDRLRNLATGALDGSNAANGGLNPDGADPDLLPDNVPTTFVNTTNTYSAIPAGLTQNINSASKPLFVSSINDPAKINASNVTINESGATLTLDATNANITIDDSDDNGAANLIATVTVSKGLITAVGGAGGSVAGTGTATITITGATEAELNARLKALTITFPDEAGAPTSADWNGNFTVTVVVNDGGNTGVRPATLIGDTNDPTADPGDYSFADATSANLVTTRIINVTVNPVNDAPVRTDATPVTLTAVAEDTANPPGSTVNALFGSKFDDAKDGITGGSTPNTFAGIAITTNNAIAAQGTWQYSTNGGTSWIALPAVSDTSALLLNATDLVRFVPAVDFHGTPGGLDARLIDTSGAAVVGGTTADVSGTNSGGITRYSDIANAVSLNTSVTAVNDAPTIPNRTIPSVAEDVASGANNGQTISTIYAGQYSDVKDDKTGITGGGNTSTPIAGLAILDNTANPLTQGKYQYSTSPGFWFDMPTGTGLGGSGNALILPATASIRFQPVTDYNGTPPALNVSAIDGSGGAVTVQTSQTIAATGGITRFSTPATLGGAVTPINDAPVISNANSTQTYTENAPGVVLEPLLSLADIDDTNITTASIRIGAGFTSGDALNFTNRLGIIGSYNATTGVLTLTGTTSRANYETALRSITFSTSSETPSTAARTISWTVTDANADAASNGVQTSLTANTTVNVVAINDAPTISALDAISANTFNDGGTPAIVDSNVTLADPELDNTTWAGSTLVIQRDVTTSTQDVFGGSSSVVFRGSNVVVAGLPVGTFTQTGGVLSITFNNNATAALVDTVAQGITYSNTSLTPPTSVTLRYTVNDQNASGNTSPQGQTSAANPAVTSLSNSATIVVNINVINEPPVFSPAPAAPTFTENGAAVPVDAGITLTDADDQNMASGSVTLTNFVPGDTLAVNTAGTSIVANYNPATGVLTLTGTDTVANYQQVLRSLTITSTSDDPTTNTTRPVANLVISVTDANADGSGAATTSTPRTVNITPINDTPVISAPPPAAIFNENGAAVPVDNTLTLTDVDDTQMASATVTITNLIAGDVLSFSTAGTNITASYNAATGVLTLSGADSTANYQQVLRSIGFSNPSDDPTVNTTRTTVNLAYSVTDANSDGVGAQTTITTRSVTIVPVNDAPVLTNTAGSATYIENSPGVNVDGSLLLTDVDDTQLNQAVVSIAGNFNAGDTLNFTNQNGITGVYNSATGVLTLSGVASVSDYQSAIRSITFSTPLDNPNTATRTVSFQVRDVNSDAASNGVQLSNLGTRDINLVAVNDPPVATSVSYTTPEDVNVTVVNLTGTDVDGTIASITIPVLPPPSQGVLYFAGGTVPVVAGVALTPAQAATLVFVPAPNFNGVVTVPFTVTDNGGLISPLANLTITINDVNDPPVAISDSVNTLEDIPVGVNLVGTDIDGTVISVTVTVLPTTAEGILYFADGVTPVQINVPMTPAQAATLIFKPATNYNSLPTDLVNIVFVVTDNDGDPSLPATFVIDVASVNDDPVAIPETKTTLEDTPVTVTLTGADAEDGTATSVNIIALPPVSQGILYLADGVTPVVAGIDYPPGNFIFKPALNYNGAVAPIPFTVKDSVGQVSSPPAILNINITSDGDPPVAIPGSKVGNEDTPIPFALTGTDSDGTVVSLTITSLPPTTQGVIFLNGSPIAANTPLTVAQAATLVFIPAPNFVGTVTIPFFVIDNGSDPSLPVNFIIQVNDVFSPPSAESFSVTTGPNVPVATPLIASDIDGTVISITIASLPPISQGVLRLADGSLAVAGVALTPAQAAGIIFTPAPGFNGLVNIPFTAIDDEGNVSNIANATINVLDIPPVARPVEVSTTPDKPINVPLTGTDVDGTVVSVTVQALPPASQGILTLANGSPVIAGVALTPAQAAGIIFTPANGFNGSVSIPFTVLDDVGVSSPVAFARVIVTDDSILFEQLGTQPNLFANGLDPNRPDPFEIRSPVIPIGMPEDLFVIHSVRESAMRIAQNSNFGVFNVDAPTRGELDNLTYDLKGLPVGMDPTLFVQHAVRSLPITQEPRLFVQNAVRQSQLESTMRNIGVTSYNTATSGVSGLFSPFDLGSTNDAIDLSIDGVNGEFANKTTEATGKQPKELALDTNTESVVNGDLNLNQLWSGIKEANIDSGLSKEIDTHLLQKNLAAEPKKVAAASFANQLNTAAKKFKSSDIFNTNN